MVVVKEEIKEEPPSDPLVPSPVPSSAPLPVIVPSTRPIQLTVSTSGSSRGGTPLQSPALPNSLKPNPNGEQLRIGMILRVIVVFISDATRID